MEPIPTRDLEVDAILAKAPLRADLNPSFLTCVRLDIWQADFEQLQAELLRLDQLLLSQRATKNRAEATYRTKRYNSDPLFRQQEKERLKRYKGNTSRVQKAQIVS